jgi:hypothetical protein
MSCRRMKLFRHFSKNYNISYQGEIIWWLFRTFYIHTAASGVWEVREKDVVTSEAAS